MSYLARLKSLKAPDDHATKPTKPLQTGDGVGFVGFVAYPQGGLEKSRGVLDKAASNEAHYETFAVEPPPAPAPAANESVNTGGVNSNPQDWHALDRAYQAHHWTCTTCISAGKGYGLRCGVGMALWAVYDEVDLPHPIRAQRATGSKGAA